MSFNMLDPLLCTYFVEIFDNLRLVGHKEVKKGIKELEARLSGVRVPRGKPHVARVLGNGRGAKHSQNTSLHGSRQNGQKHQAQGAPPRRPAHKCKAQRGGAPPGEDPRAAHRPRATELQARAGDRACSSAAATGAN